MKIDPVPFAFFSGIYDMLLKFTDETVSSHISMIKHWFLERFKEHKYDFKFSKFYTALSVNIFIGCISFIDFHQATSD